MDSSDKEKDLENISKRSVANGVELNINSRTLGIYEKYLKNSIQSFFHEPQSTSKKVSIDAVSHPISDSPSDHIAFLLSSVSPLCTLFLIFPHAICLCSPSFTPAFSFKDAHTSSFLFFAHFSRCSLMHKRKSHPFLPDDFLFCPGSQNSHFF